MNHRESWVNNKNVPLLDKQNIRNNNIFFLYAFLGDGFNIEKIQILKNLEKWKKQNTNWNINILRKDYDKIMTFVERHFPWFLNVYINYPKNIQKCDTIRYMLMYHYGGAYSDLDVFPNLSLSNLLMTYPKANVIFGVGRIKSKEKCIKTTEIESIRDGILEIPTRLSNYFFVSRIPNHPIWIDILNLALERSKKTIQSQYGIIYTTGPDLVTTAVYNNIHKYNDIVIIPYEGFQKLYVHEAASFNDKNSWRTRTNLPVDESGSNNV